MILLIILIYYLSFKGSTTAYQALTPYNVRRREIFWNLPLPLGIRDVPVESIIDVDEASVAVEKANRVIGKALCGIRVKQIGNYSRGTKITLILAIGANNFKFLRISNDPGTTHLTFYEFVEEMIRTVRPGIRLVLLWDNLNSHFSDALIRLIYEAGHVMVARPAYYPVDGPIEYMFNYIENQLALRQYTIRNSDDIIQNIISIVTNITAEMIDNTFRNVGY